MRERNACVSLLRLLCSRFKARALRVDPLAESLLRVVSVSYKERAMYRGPSGLRPRLDLGRGLCCLFAKTFHTIRTVAA